MRMAEAFKIQSWTERSCHLAVENLLMGTYWLWMKCHCESCIKQVYKKVWRNSSQEKTWG